MNRTLFAFASGDRHLEKDVGRPPATTADGAEPKPAPLVTRRQRFGAHDGEPIIGYVSAPIDGDATRLHASERAIELACHRAGWRLLDVLHDPEQRRTMRRPSLLAALERIADGEARGLVVSHARFLGESTVDLAPLMTWFQQAHATFIALDLGLDTSTQQGRRVALALIRLSGWNRGGNGAGHALPELHARDAANNGAVNPRHAGLLERLAAMHDDGMSLQEMADQLNAEAVPTLYGGDAWWPSSVRTALRYARAKSVTRADGLPSLEDRTRS
jgi:Resolvase, N terminal domain